MMKPFFVACALLLLATAANAQPAPLTATTIKSTDSSTTSLCVGCPVGTTTPATNSGLQVHLITLKDAMPSVTTNRLYNIAGALYFNGVSVATGSSISGTANTVGLFTGATVIGNSIITQNGGATLVTVTGGLTVTGTVTGNLFSGSGASLTAIPTSAVSSGNFVATVASGTGITSSVTTGNAAATTISLNNTAVTPNSYGSSTSIPSFTVDQQGRLTAAAGNVVIAPAGTLTGTTLAANVVTTSITAVGTITTGIWNAGAVTSSGIITGTVLHPTAAPAAAMSIGQSGNTLIFQGGTSGHQWADSTNGNARMTLSDLGAFATTGFSVSAAGSVNLGVTNLTDSIAAPTIASGFGTSPSIAGKAYAFKVTVGSSPSTTGTVTFNATYASAPVCVATGDAAGTWTSAFRCATTTTQAVIDVTGGNMIAGGVISVLIRGF